MCEWIAGALGRHLGLTIASFEVVSISEDLIGLASRPDLADLGAGLAFGSCRRAITELTVKLLLLDCRSNAFWTMP